MKGTIYYKVIIDSQRDPFEGLRYGTYKNSPDYLSVLVVVLTETCY